MAEKKPDSLSRRIRDLLEARGHHRLEGRPGTGGGMTPREVSDAMGITVQRDRDIVCQMMIQMFASDTLTREGSIRKYRYILLRNPESGGGGRHTPMSRREFLDKRKAYNEQARRRKGMLPLAERIKLDRAKWAEHRAAKQKKLESEREVRRLQRLADKQKAKPAPLAPVERQALALRRAVAGMVDARPSDPLTAPPKPVFVSSEDFVRQFANDPTKVQVLPGLRDPRREARAA